MTSSPAEVSQPAIRDTRSSRGDALLHVQGLTTGFATEEGFITAVDNVSFSVQRGEAVALVGESGSGKSVTALSIMRLVQSPGRIVAGSVFFRGTNLLELPAREMRRFRGNDIAMIFQEPMTSLNPVFRIGDQIAEAIRIHQNLGRKGARAKAIEMLELVSI
ncbi:MAG TPA: ATP-binding cassette domain-containing protein, partial [Thermoanaerobaculia bacterium]|nr:ATP-binding cassette domain-containing protein [Thermoanaerobaculia bacterium]